MVFWDDASNVNTQYPFSHEQVGIVSDCKENLLTILEALEEEVTHVLIG